MDERKMEKLFGLVDYLKRSAVREREESSSSWFAHGLSCGYASAYELCARWLDEIIS